MYSHRPGSLRIFSRFGDFIASLRPDGGEAIVSSAVLVDWPMEELGLKVELEVGKFCTKADAELEEIAAMSAKVDIFTILMCR